MKKIQLLLCCILLLVLDATAQYDQDQNKVWALYRNAGLDFRGGEPVVISSNLHAIYGGGEMGSASLADTDGMVFYTNGTNVWNSLGNLMPHGTRINGPANNSEGSSQGALIVPELSVLSKFSRYYIFSLDPYNTPGRVFCNLVDLELNGGLGDVDTSFYLHHVPIDSGIAQTMIAIPGCDNNIWVIVHNKTGPIYKAYEITTTGINLNPVISTISTLPANSAWGGGVMKSSPRGDKILHCSGKMIVSDFDRSTGIISNSLVLDSIMVFGYAGGDFSPNGKKVYGKGSLGAEIYQFDLSAPNPPATKTLVGSSVGATVDLQLAPDHKIYFIANLGYTAGARYLGRINFPDNTGAACGFQDTVTTLFFPNNNPDFTPRGFFPNVVMYPTAAPSVDTRLVLDSLVCPFSASGLLLNVPGYSNYTWDNGSVSASRTATQSGTYWVKYRLNPCAYRTDTFRIRRTSPPLSIVLNNDTLSTASPYITYQWYKNGQMLTGSTGRKCALSGNGLYAVKVTDANGCIDSLSYQAGLTGLLTPGNASNVIHIYPNPAQDEVVIDAPFPVSVFLSQITGQQLLSERQKRTINIRHIPNGLYFLRICDRDGRLLKTEKLLIRH